MPVTPGLSPRGTKMPQTIEELQYLLDLYDKGMGDAKIRNEVLRTNINKLEQKIEKYKREHQRRVIELKLRIKQAYKDSDWDEFHALLEIERNV